MGSLERKHGQPSSNEDEKVYHEDEHENSGLLSEE